MVRYPGTSKHKPGTRKEIYNLGAEDVETLRDEGVEIGAVLPGDSIEVLYTENGDGYTSVSVTAENYLLPERELATHSGDDLDWVEVRQTLRELDQK